MRGGERRHADQGAKIRAARQRVNVSGNELARRTGIDQGTISRLESGRGRLAVDFAQRIADALGVPINDIVARDPDKAVADWVGDRRVLLRKMQTEGADRPSTRREAGKPASRVPYITAERIEEDALALLRELDRLPSVPSAVDPYDVAKRAGIPVLESNGMPPGVDGAFDLDSGEILIRKLWKSDTPTTRRRVAFALAHELGHARYHRDLFPADGEPPTEAEIARADIQANRAASAMLLPADHFRDAYHAAGGDSADPAANPDDLALSLARVFGTNLAPVQWRADVLGLPL